MEADYPDITAALDADRQTFGSWCCFKTNVGETEQARNLGKAARVIIDEAEMVGPGYKVNVTGQQDVRASNGAPGAVLVSQLEIQLDILCNVKLRILYRLCSRNSAGGRVHSEHFSG